MIEDRVLRPAMVAVAKGGPKPAPDGPGGASDAAGRHWALTAGLSSRRCSARCLRGGCLRGDLGQGLAPEFWRLRAGDAVLRPAG